jgi:peptidyl-prolyl cis-trans isomerase D
MLNFMRRQRSNLKWVWVGLIVVLGGGMLVQFIPWGDGFGTFTVTTDVAQVGNETITAEEFQSAYLNYVRNMQQELTPEIRRAFGFDRQILDSLISQKVVVAEARRLGLEVTPEEIQQSVLSNPAFLSGGSFVGLQRYEEMLQQANWTAERYETAVKNDLLISKAMNFITAGVAVTDKEAEEEYRRRNEKASLSYFVVDPLNYESKVALSEAELKDYYEKNKAKYNVSEKRKSRYAFVDTVEFRKKATTDDTELRAFYDEHLEEYRLPEQVTAQHILFKDDGTDAIKTENTRKKATEILARAKKQEDFGKLAKEFSEDSSAAQGGDLGTFGRGQMVPEFEQSAFSLGVGAISDLVKSQFGFHIIKVNGKQEGRLRTFEEIKEAIRPRILFDKGGKQAKDIAEKIALELVTTPDLNAVAAKNGATVKETALVEQTDPIVELGNAQPYLAKVFALAKGQFGTAIEVQNGYAVPEVVDIQPSHPASFEEARVRAQTDAKAEKTRQMATDITTKIQEQVKGGSSDIASLARIASATVKTSEKAIRGASLPDFGSTAERESEIFSLPIGKVGTPATLGFKTLVFAVKEREAIKPEDMKKAVPELRKDLLGPKRELYFMAYIKEKQKQMESENEIARNLTVMSQLADRIN